MVQDIGLVGVGAVGSNFARWLCEDGYDLTAFDVDGERLQEAVDYGATAGDDPADVAASAELVVLSLPGSQYVETVMEGEDGVLDELGEGEVVVDAGTTRPDVDARYAALLEERGAGLVDAPLTWGGPGDYTEEHGPAYTMFVGGADEHYDVAREVIETLSYSHTHFGGVGKGQVMKAGHRAWQNNRAAVDAEFAEFLRNNGVDPEAADETLGMGLRDRLFEEDYPDVSGFEDAIEGGDPDPLSERSYRLESGTPYHRLRESHFAKDQAYAVSIGHSTNTALPITNTVYQQLLASENYAAAMFDREIAFQDPQWTDRGDIVSVFRRLNRPAEEWRRLANNGED